MGLLVCEIVDTALSEDASDIHLNVGSPPYVRAGGALGPLGGFPPLDRDQLQEMAAWVFAQARRGDQDGVAAPIERDRLEERWTGDHDLAFSYAGWRFRASVYQQRSTAAIALRVIPRDVPPFEALGLPESVRRFAMLHHGMVLVCGPTGSGKTTSLAALIDTINTTQNRHILTLEDPIEYLHTSKRSLVHQREVGALDSGGDTESFARGLKSALREDPDVILVGEMRDLETIQLALTAAETGHLVFATLHSTDSASTVGRVIDVFPPSQQDQVRIQLATVLRGIVCQAILPRADKPGGRCVVAEVCVVDHAISNLIREAKTEQIISQIEVSADKGMQTFDMALAAAVAAGRVDGGLALDLAHDLAAYQGHLAHAHAGGPQGFGLDWRRTAAGVGSG